MDKSIQCLIKTNTKIWGVLNAFQQIIIKVRNNAITN